MRIHPACMCVIMAVVILAMVVMCVLFVAMVVVGFFARVLMVRVGVCIMRMILMLILMCPMLVMVIMVIMAIFAAIRMGITLLRCKAYAVTGFQKDRTRNIQKSDMRGRRGETVQ